MGAFLVVAADITVLLALVRLVSLLIHDAAAVCTEQYAGEQAHFSIACLLYTSYPVTKEVREQLNTAVLQAYEAKLEQMAERGSVGRASISDQLQAGKAAAEQAKAERPPKEKPSRGAER